MYLPKLFSTSSMQHKVIFKRFTTGLNSARLVDTQKFNRPVCQIAWVNKIFYTILLHVHLQHIYYVVEIVQAVVGIHCGW